MLSGSRVYRGLVEVHPGKFDFRDLESLVGYFRESSSFNARRLAEACLIFERMIREGSTVCLTLAGAYTPTGLGGSIIPLLEAGFIDFIISTGANLYHDMHFALGLPVYWGDFRADDLELHEEGLVRIYDLFIPVETLLETDRFIQESLRGLKGRVSSAELHHRLGACLLDGGGGRSILAAAARLDVPVYTPSPGDSSIGMNLSFLSSRGNDLVVDPSLDVLETTAIVFEAEKNGVFVVGGGAPKNFYMQTQPMLKQVMSIDKGGHDYFVQITVDPEYYGGLSGATHREAVSWGKMNPEEMGNGVVVYCDATIAVPLIFGYVRGRVKRRRLRRLYLRRARLLDGLREGSSRGGGFG